MSRRFAIIIPACDEEACIATVLAELRAVLPGDDFLYAIGVNASRDRTAEIARAAGGLVAVTAQRGYGYGCQAAIDLVKREVPDCEAYLFVAGDGANDPADIPKLIAAYQRGVPIVLGSRTRLPENRTRENLPYIVANRFLGAVCGLLTGRFFQDLGPLRLIERDVFDKLALREFTFGWTIEAQVRAAMLGIETLEVDVRERLRLAGEQKVSRVSWTRTLAIGCRITAAAVRTRFRPQ